MQKQLVQQLEREVRIMYELDHPYIIKIFTHFEDDRNVYVVMEFAAGGHMFKLLRRLREFDERTSAQYLREIVSALQYLHSHDPPIIHRDIKPENILLDAEGRCKLADFGWSNFYMDDSVRDTYCGTLDYLAPEMVDRAGHTVKLDIWSVGILLFEMLAGKAPFEAKQKEALFDNIRKLKLRFPMTFPPLAKDLVRKLLKINPAERISLEELLTHQWLRTVSLLRPLMLPGSEVPETKAASRPGTGFSSPKGVTRVKVGTVESPQVQERMRALKQLQDRCKSQEEEVKRVNESKAQLQSALTEAAKRRETAAGLAATFHDQIDIQTAKLKSISESLQRAKDRRRAYASDLLMASSAFSHYKFKAAVLMSQLASIKRTVASFTAKTAETDNQVSLFRSLKGLRRSTSLPKMSEMIASVCDFNRKLRLKPRTQSARKERTLPSAHPSPHPSSPLITPRRLKTTPTLPPSTGSTPRRVSRPRTNC